MTKAMKIVFNLVREDEHIKAGDFPAKTLWLSIHKELRRLDPENNPLFFEEKLSGQVAIATRDEGLRLLAQGIPGASREEVLRQAMVRFWFAGHNGDESADEGNTTAQAEYLNLKSMDEIEKNIAQDKGAMNRQVALKVFKDGVPGFSREESCDAAWSWMNEAIELGDKEAATLIKDIPHRSPPAATGPDT